MRHPRPLTPRQHVILRGVARGATNKEIAHDLGITEQGVKVHISRLLDRYQASNRVELVAVTRAWAESDDRAYASLTTDIADIRSGLSKDVAGSGGRAETRAASLGPQSFSPGSPNELLAAVTELRELLNEVNVAAKLAHETANGRATPELLEAIRARARAALEQSARVGAIVEREISAPRRTARAN
jgi:two-component system nitrate/nitrite response regulator NarL